MLRVGLEVELLLPSHQSGHVVRGEHVVRSPPGDAQELPLITDAAGVMAQLAERDRSSQVGHVVQVRLYLVV